MLLDSKAFPKLSRFFPLSTQPLRHRNSWRLPIVGLAPPSDHPTLGYEIFNFHLFLNLVVVISWNENENENDNENENENEMKWKCKWIEMKWNWNGNGNENENEMNEMKMNKLAASPAMACNHAASGSGSPLG